jgi:hypothetical protein
MSAAIAPRTQKLPILRCVCVCLCVSVHLVGLVSGLQTHSIYTYSLDTYSFGDDGHGAEGLLAG